MNSTIQLHSTPIRTSMVGDVRAAIRSEWIKLRTVRATPFFVGLTVVIGVAMSLILGRVVKTDPYEDLPFTIGNTFLVSSWLTTLFAVVAGTLVFTSEVHHGTLAGALTARPSKPTLVAAKAVVAAALGFTMGAVGIVGGLIGGLASGMDTGDLSGATSGVAWALVLTTLASCLGLGVGLIVRHSAASVTSVLVWALAVETLVRGFVPATVSRLLPFTAAHGLLGTRSAADTPETLAAAFPNVANAAVIGCWAAVAVVIGTALLIRQDS
ncbi:MAG TPA: ABC transporter permease [Ilumatobacteraceae bacterium]|nr:ABC transporter permease [Ilumatobacteraceae bacterium]